MPTNDFRPIAIAAGAVILSQADWIAFLAANPNGWPSGIVPATRMNKAIRQSSVISSALAQYVSDALAADVLDPDGGVAVATITAQILAAITATALAATGALERTGDVKLGLWTTAAAGWVLCNDGTIGSATSGASTRANADTATLFTLLWNNVTDTYAPVSTGRGGSAAADFAANKTIGLTKMLGRSLAVFGTGSGLSARVMGQNLGEETHLLTTAEQAAHTHTQDANTRVSGGGAAQSPNVAGSDTLGGTTASSGGGGTHNNMQPSSFLNAMIKL